MWEQKDHSGLALAALTSALPTLEAHAPCSDGGSVHVRVTGLHGDSKVEASVSLRKDKVMPLFDFTLCVTWEALWVRPPPPPSGVGGGGEGGAPPPAARPGVKLAAGELRTSGIGPDDVGEEFPVGVRLTQAPATPTPALAALVALAKDTASGTLATLLRRTLRAMAGWLLTLDTREDLIAAGVARRAEEEERVKRVGGGVRSTNPTPVAVPLGSPTTGGEGGGGEEKGMKQGIEGGGSPTAPPTATHPSPSLPIPTIINPGSSSSSSSSLPLLSAAAAQMASTASATAVSLPVASHRVESAGAPPELQPSKWNRAGWGYEDKDMTPWAHKHLKSKLTGFDIDVKGGHLRIVEVDITGEASKIISRVSATARGLAFVCVCMLALLFSPPIWL